MRFERDNIRKMKGYAPGEQLNESGVTKLNTNENPYPPSPAVAAVLRELDAERLRRYPPPLADGIREAAAELHGLTPEHVMATNGGDELLRLVLTTFVEPEETVVITRPSYSLYPVLTQIHGCRLREIDLEGDWSLPETFIEELQESEAKLCILVNPHAPSGLLLGADYLERLARAFSGLLLVDEAYVDFVEPSLGYDAVSLVRKLDNVLLLRTLSKGYSLAGLRVGYGLGDPGLISPMLSKTRDSYNTDLLAQELATAALHDQVYARECWSRVRDSRETLSLRLKGMGFSIAPSQSNFLLCEVPDGNDAKELQLALKKRKVLVRYFDQERLRDKLRISIGSEAENRVLVDTLKELLA